MTEKNIVNGIEIATRTDGSDDNPWLVLSNSLGSSMMMWEPQMPSLIKHFKVLRYDTRGHGESAVPDGPYNFNDFTADVIGLLDHFGIASASFMGVSLGGMTGMGLGLEFPSRIDKLVVADARSDAPEESHAMWDQRIARIEEGGMEAIIEETLDGWISSESRSARPELADMVREMVGGTDQAGYIATCMGLKQLDYLKDLPKLSIPTLYIGGSDDERAPPVAMQAMSEQTPNSDFVMIEGARHLANLDKPEAFNEAVLGFLTR